MLSTSLLKHTSPILTLVAGGLLCFSEINIVLKKKKIRYERTHQRPDVQPGRKTRRKKEIALFDIVAEPFPRSFQFFKKNLPFFGYLSPMHRYEAMNPNQWTDQQIIDGIKDANARDKTLYAVFHLLGWRGAAIAFVKKYGGNEQDGEEIASDALIAFDYNIRHDRFEGRSSLKTYFLSIVRNRWLKHLRKHRPDVLPETELPADTDDSVEEVFVKEEYWEVFKLALEQTGERCKKILELYMLDARMEEIALAMNLANADMAKKAAYRCRMAMREFLEKHPAWLERLKG